MLTYYRPLYRPGGAVADDSRVNLQVSAQTPGATLIKEVAAENKRQLASVCRDRILMVLASERPA